MAIYNESGLTFDLPDGQHFRFSALAGADLVALNGGAKPYRYQALIDKLTDSLLMLLAAWADTDLGLTIKAELPLLARSRLPLKLVIALDLPAELTVHLPVLRDSLNERMRGRMALADVRGVALIDYPRLLANPVFGAFIKAQV